MGPQASAMPLPAQGLAKGDLTEGHQAWAQWFSSPESKAWSGAQNWATRPDQSQPTRADGQLIPSDLGRQLCVVGRTTEGITAGIRCRKLASLML